MVEVIIPSYESNTTVTTAALPLPADRPVQFEMSDVRESYVALTASYQGQSITINMAPERFAELADVIPDDGHRIATFILEQDDDSRLIFGDIAGIAFGVGVNVRSAFEAWEQSAREILGSLHAAGPRLASRLEARRQVLDDILR